MVLSITCSCGRRFEVSSESAGGTVSCPGCFKILAISRPRAASYDVFISYSSVDKAVADAVCRTLEARRLRCWIAPRNILGGMKYGQSIIEGLESSRVMVLVLSSSSNNSEQVEREVERAASKHLPIVPLRIENVEISKNLEFFLGGSHWLDAMGPSMGRHLEGLADTVQVLLTARPETPPAPGLSLPASAAEPPTGAIRQAASTIISTVKRRSKAIILTVALASGLVIIPGGLVAYYLLHRPAATAQDHFSRAAGLAEKNDLDGALVELNKAIEIDPNFKDAYFNRAGIHSVKQDWSRMIADLTRVVEIDPQSELGYLNRALAHYRNTNYENAIQDCRRTLRLNPSNAVAQQLLDQANTDKEQSSSGVRGDDSSTSVGSQQGQEAYQNGVNALVRGELSVAVAFLTTALQYNPKSINAHGNRGIAYHRLGMYDEAIADFSEMLLLDPESIAAHNFRGQSALLKRDYDQAIADLTEVLRHEQNPTTLKLRGRAYASRADYEKAIADYSEAIRQNPQDGEAYYFRGLAYGKAGQAQRAAADRQRATALDPGIERDAEPPG